MNVLIVDDMSAVVESIENGIDWEAIEIEEVYTAHSAKEAKLILLNFDVDLLLTDIEMPEEDGISLFRWAKENQPSIVGIFLTSHAEFDYAREAIKLGGFDYILQPARMEDITACLIRAIAEARKQVKYQRLERSSSAMESQRDGMLELLCARQGEGRTEESRETFLRLKQSLLSDFEDAAFHILYLQVIHFDKRPNRWDVNLVKLVFRNVLEELFEGERAKVIINAENMENYVIFIAAQKGKISDANWRQEMEEFEEFFNSRMDFRIAVYPDTFEQAEFRSERADTLRERCDKNVEKHPGIFWVDVDEDGSADENAERIRMAEDFIKANVNRAVSRGEVAEYLHLNEEYFSRLFKKYTGHTFKDYDMSYRVGLAKYLLENTRLSISIVASKVGYDNFSHFSKVFKKETGETPQEYRKNREKTHL